MLEWDLGRNPVAFRYFFDGVELSILAKWLYCLDLLQDAFQLVKRSSLCFCFSADVLIGSLAFKIAGSWSTRDIEFLSVAAFLASLSASLLPLNLVSPLFTFLYLHLTLQICDLSLT